MRSSGCSGHTKQGVVGPVPREDAVKMLRVAVVVVIVVAVAVALAVAVAVVAGRPMALCGVSMLGALTWY